MLTNEDEFENENCGSNTLLKVKTMFASFKKLFRKDTDTAIATSIPESPAPSENTTWNAIPDKPIPVTFAPEIAAAPTTFAPPPVSPDSIALPVKVVVASLPNSLASSVQSQGNGFITLPSERVATELPKGAVKIPFGELRMAAPPGTFFENARHDQTLIELPLSQILPRLNPALLSRRTNQKKIQIPDEIGNVFGPHGEGITVSKTRSDAVKPAPIPPAPPVATPFVPAPVSMENTAPIRMTTLPKPTEKPVLAPTVVPAPIIPAPVIPAPQLRVITPQSAPKAERLEIPLSALNANWPEAIKAEIVHSNLSNAILAAPIEKIEPALRTGKIAFTWKQLCAWIEPKIVNHAEASEEMLELPLNVVAPLFMAKHRPAKVQKKISIVDMPDLFAGRNIAPVAAPPPPPPATPSPKIHFEPAPVVEPKPIALPAFEKKANALGELFGQPTKQTWSPNEIVKSLAKLPGVTGAFIAMQDGLLVAAQLPTTLKADTVAAFLPQIFGRMNQYAKELQLGALSSLSFEVHESSWQIVKIGSVYLVVLAKIGEELSREKINRVATEISKQIQ